MATCKHCCVGFVGQFKAGRTPEEDGQGVHKWVRTVTALQNPTTGAWVDASAQPSPRHGVFTLIAARRDGECRYEVWGPNGAGGESQMMLTQAELEELGFKVCSSCRVDTY